MRCAGVFSAAGDLQRKFEGHGDVVLRSSPGALRNGEGIDGALVFAVVIDGELLATGGADGTIRIWRWQTGEMAGRVDNAHGDLEIMSLELDGDFVVSTGGTEVKLWRMSDDANNVPPSWQPPQTVHPKCQATIHHEGYVRATALGSEIVVSGGEDATCRIWPRATTIGEDMAPSVILDHPGSVWALAVDGDLLATACRDENTAACELDTQVRLWRLSTSQCVYALSDPSGNHREKVTCLALRNGLLASGGRDGFIKVWDCSKGAEAPPECVTSMRVDQESLVSRSATSSSTPPDDDAVAAAPSPTLEPPCAIQGLCITKQGGVISLGTGAPELDQQGPGHHQLTMWSPRSQV